MPKCPCGMDIKKGGSLGHCPKCKCRFVGSLCYGPPCQCEETKNLQLDTLILMVEMGMNPEEETKFLFEKEEPSAQEVS